MKIVKKIAKPNLTQPTNAEEVTPQVAANIEIQQPTATITKTYQDQTSTSEQVPVGAPGPVPQPHANVGVSMGMTINTGDYSNIKFQVSLFCPCEVVMESIDATYAEVKSWVDSKVDEIHTEIRAQLG